MADIYRGSTVNINVDTMYLRDLAVGIKTVATTMNESASIVNKARRHENWHCNERWNVSNEVNLIKGHSERIASYLSKLAIVLEQSANEFESGQSKTLATMTSATFIGL